MTEERVAQIIFEELARPGSPTAWIDRAAAAIMDEAREWRDTS